MNSFESNILTPGAQLWGWIKFFNAEKGFGFVSVHLANDEQVDVFIRAEKGCKVTGTNSDYVLTDEPFDYSSYRFRRDSTEIAVVVEPSSKGSWRAKSWGVMPEYTWIDHYLEYPHILEDYVGGRIELHNRSEHGSGGYDARIDGLELTREQLTVRARHYPKGWQPGCAEPSDDKLGRAFEHSYPLEGVKQNERFWLELSWRTKTSTDMLRFFSPSRR